MGLGARARGMGGAFVVMNGDVYSGYYNPAGLPDLPAWEAAFSYRNLSLDRQFYYVGFAVKVPPAAGIAIGWIHAGISSIDGRDFTGSHTRMYTDTQNGFLVAFGVQINKYVNIGIGGTLLRENLLDITAKGFGLNAGIMVKPVNSLTLGAAVRDIGAHYSWNSETLFERGSSITDDFPTAYAGGARLHVKRVLTDVEFELFKNSKSKTGYRFGLENNYLSVITLRGGINDGDFTAGFGLRFPLMRNEGRLDYAFEMSRIDPETTQIISFRIIF